MAKKSTKSQSDGTAADGERLQKVLAQAGVGSRRACEILIEQGYVEVNGEIVRELPVFVDPSRDRIVVDGKVIRQGERLLYVMLYKPSRTVTTLADEAGRRTVADLVKHPSGIRLFPVGRLDYDTVGLVLMTNDGDLANRLTHPRFGVEKTYRVVVKGALPDEEIERIERGMFLATRREGRTVGADRTSSAAIALVKRDEARTVIDVTLREGRNREVRRLLAKAGCPVKKLLRTQMGPLKLKGLRLGEWRELTPGEVRTLKRFDAERNVSAPKPSTRRQSSASRTGPKRPKMRS